MTLIAMRGLPASGKSTYAIDLVTQDPLRWVRVNRDLLRLMLHNGIYLPDGDGSDGTERTIRFARDGVIKAMLERGLNVIVDDTNLPNRSIRELYNLAKFARTDFDIVDLTDVPVETCIARNAQRDEAHRVPESVILNMYDRYVKGRQHPIPVDLRTQDYFDPMTAEVYIPRLNTPKVYLVDLDGTVAHMGIRSPYDPAKVHEDRPHEDVVNVVKVLVASGYHIIFVSGRSDICREATVNWIHTHIYRDASLIYANNKRSEFDLSRLPTFRLFMRREGDTRSDWQVKLDIFNAEVRSRFHVLGVFDDRKQVVDMWRGLGLTVFQVGEGNF